jgi:hypothetical protein
MYRARRPQDRKVASPDSAVHHVGLDKALVVFGLQFLHLTNEPVGSNKSLLDRRFYKIVSLMNSNPYNFLDKMVLKVKNMLLCFLHFIAFSSRAPQSKIVKAFANG